MIISLISYIPAHVVRDQGITLSIICPKRLMVDNITLLNFNIRSVCHNVDNILALLSSLNSFPDITVLSETWLTERLTSMDLIRFTLLDQREEVGEFLFLFTRVIMPVNMPIIVSRMIQLNAALYVLNLNVLI